MPIVTLITDWNNSDHYVGSLKGELYSLMPQLQVIDITHQIPPFSILQASFVLQNSYKRFPKGTIHLICVNSEAGAESSHLAVEHNEHYFISANNGIFDLLFDQKPETIIQIDNSHDSSFAEVSVFAKAAVHLANGGNINDLGKPATEIKMQMPLRATLDNSVINGSVIFIDSYGNAITNITRANFESIGKGRPFDILVQSNHYRISKINRFYNETNEQAELLALFNTSGLLEIAMFQANVSQLLNLTIKSIIRVKFYDKEKREELKLS
jgi:S-adenosylmethionine hydrolase